MPDTIRPLAAGERLSLATMWQAAWHDAHAPAIPADLVKLHTLDDFVERVAVNADYFRVIGPIGDPCGLTLTRDDELQEIHLAKSLRGKGMAGKLLADAEMRMREAGFDHAWLNCVVGNDRAAHFFEKSGWHRRGSLTSMLDTALGPYAISIWRFEKTL